MADNQPNDISDFLNKTHAAQQRGRSPILEQLQKQFPGVELVPFPQDSIVVVASSNNYVTEIEIPSGASFFEIFTDNGVYVSKSQIVFPITESQKGVIFCPKSKRYLARGVKTLKIGLLAVGDVATLAFHSQLFDSNTDASVGQ